jgi:nucleoside-diphosphate-sugar epimerase
MFTIVAGTGYTGHRVLEQLPADGAVGLSRSFAKTSRTCHLVDFDTLETLPLQLPDRYGVLYTCPPRGESDDRIRRFLALLMPAPARFVYISTTGVYGDCKGAIVTEESPVNPGSPMSKPRVAAESLLERWAAKNGCEIVVLRSPGIYGPGRLGVERLIAEDPYLNEADAHPGNRIHVDDLASCCLAALSEEAPTGIYNVGDGDHRTATQFAREVARQADLGEPCTISWAQAQDVFSPMRLAFLSSSRIVDTTKMRDVLGVTPRTPEQGIRDSLAQEAQQEGPASKGS